MVRAIPASVPSNVTQLAQYEFLRLLPKVRALAQRAFRRYPLEEREELVQETMAHVYCALVRLVERGQARLAFATPLTGFAIRQIRAGRRVGQRSNVRDISSAYAQRRQGITLERLDQFDRPSGEWLEALVEDKRSTPAEIAASRLDFAAWLRSLPAKRRKLALFLARGETTKSAATRFRISPARISQLRQVLRASWGEFQGEAAHTAGACSA